MVIHADCEISKSFKITPDSCPGQKNNASNIVFGNCPIQLSLDASEGFSRLTVSLLLSAYTHTLFLSTNTEPLKASSSVGRLLG